MASWIDDRSTADAGAAGKFAEEDWGNDGDERGQGKAGKGTRKSVLLGIGKSSSGLLGGEAARSKRTPSGEEREEEARKERTPPNMVRKA